MVTLMVCLAVLTFFLFVEIVNTDSANYIRGRLSEEFLNVIFVGFDVDCLLICVFNTFLSVFN